MNIVIFGGIGVGKTTAGLHVASKVGGEFHKEIKGHYVKRFYQESKRYAFVNQVDYMGQLLFRELEISKEKINIQDRSIHDTHSVFSEMMHEDYLLTKVEFDSLKHLYETSLNETHRVDAAVLFRCDDQVAFSRVKRRGDEEEAELQFEYLSRLSRKYDEWFGGVEFPKKIFFDTTDLDRDGAGFELEKVVIGLI